MSVQADNAVGWNRQHGFKQLTAEPFDLLILGGGITGAGLALEASTRGLRVALIDANDFASGTSSRSTKMLHGGLRYLERGEVALVKKSALERKQIHELAPHLSEPRWMVLPISNRAKLLGLRVAVTTYDHLGGVQKHERNRTWKGAELTEQEPKLKQSEYPYALAYREYLTDDARLVLANVRAATQRGVCAVNHTKITEFIQEGGQATGAKLRCQLTGNEGSIQARAIVNATGPWVEELQRLEDPSAKPILHLSKGIHITLPANKLPVQNLLALPTPDGRRIFVMRREEIVYVGTTDTTYEPGAEVWPEITAEDVDYLLEVLPTYLDIPPLTRDDIIGAWAGLRPLIADPTKSDPTELSRKDEVLHGKLGVISIAGGKLTGYRAMARRVMESVEERVTAPKAPPSELEKLPGGNISSSLHEFSQELAISTGLSASVCSRLARLYGSEATAVLKLGSAPLCPGLPVAAGEVTWAMQHEFAATLEDMIYRRLRLPALSLDPNPALEPAAEIMAPALGWSAQEQAQQLRNVRELLAKELSFQRQ